MPGAMVWSHSSVFDGVILRSIFPRPVLPWLLLLSARGTPGFLNLWGACQDVQIFGDSPLTTKPGGHSSWLIRISPSNGVEL